MNTHRLICCLCIIGLVFAQPLRAAKAATPVTPVTPAPAAPEAGVEETGIPTGKYIAGGIVGSAVGFGIGHAIQDRYLPLGLIFTVGESLGVIAYAYGLAEGITNGLISGSTSSSNNGFGLALLGAGVIIGLRVWEIVDIWVTGSKLHKTYMRAHPAGSLSILPAAIVRGETAPGLTVGLTF